MTLQKSILLATIAFAFLSHIAAAQLIPAPTPIADPSDTRFVGVKEDFTSPRLATSSLCAVPPLSGYINDYGTYTVELVQLQWRFGDPLDVYVMKPKGMKNPPVILYLYSYPSTTDRFKNEDFQKTVTKDGFAAVGFVSALTGHRYHDRPMREWFISELQESLAESAHDVQMVLDYLGNRGDLDMTRVGMFSSGSGASIGILASAADPRIKVLDALDPWADWPTWMAKSPFVPADERARYITPEFQKKAEVLEPIEWLPKIQARRFRLQQVLFEQMTPLAAKEKLRASAPANSTIAIYKTPDEFNAVVRDNKDLQWIRGELQSLPQTQPEFAPGRKASRGK